MRLVGVDVWFDDWEIRAGDSIPGKMNEGLGAVDTVVILWSSDADRSEWVRAELETAITRGMQDETLRVIPSSSTTRRCRLSCSGSSGSTFATATRPAPSTRSWGSRRTRNGSKAIQQELDEAGIEVRYFHGYGPVVCCPRCGADVDQLEGWSAVDRRDDTYAGFRCTVCGFNDGGEIF